MTLSAPVDQCLSIVTTLPGAVPLVDGHHNVGTKNPPLDFSLKKEDLQSTSTQTSSCNKRQISARFSAGDCPSDVSQSFPSPSKMLRLSFNMQNEMFRQSGTKIQTEGLLKCSETKSHLAVVVEDLSNKPSTSTNAMATSAAQANNKDMWRPW